MKKYPLLLLFLNFVIFTNFSFACSYFEYGVPICAEFTRADAVFIGQAIKVEDLTGIDDYSDNMHRVHFKVKQNFKGAESSTFTIVTNDWGSACGLNIKKGQTWIIYAKYDDEEKGFKSNNGRKFNVKKNKEEFDILKAASERKTDTTISGRLTSFGGIDYNYEPVEITFEGNGIRQLLTTNEEGIFRTSPLTVGNYKVKMKFPFNANLNFLNPELKYIYTEGNPTFFEYNVELKQGDCNYSFFEIFRNSK